MAELRKKYQLPVCQKIPGIQFDIIRLQQELNNFEQQFVDVVTANRLFCSNNVALADDVYENFEQVSLTTMSDDFLPEVSKELCHSYNQTLWGKTPVSPLESYRRKSRRNDIHPALK